MDAPLVAAARSLAVGLHADQVDKAGAPYAGHLMRVARRAVEAGADDVAVAAAYLHDSIEDGRATVAGLVDAGIPMAVVDVVVTVTRQESESYEEFIDRIASHPDPVVRARAVAVKLADLADNTDPQRTAVLAASDPGKAASLARRYAAAVARLTSAG